MKKILIFAFFFLFFLSISPKEVKATVLFHDDFDNGDVSQWNVEYITPSDPSHLYWQQSKWLVANGRYGIDLKNRQMRTYSVIAGDRVWTNFIYTLEIKGSGVDKNIIFYYNDKNNWYGFHFVPNGIYLGKNKEGIYSSNLVSYFSVRDNVSYKMKVKINNGKVSFYIDDLEIIKDYQLTDNFISGGKIALYASTGDSYPTSIYFDNITICTIDDPSQCDYSPEYFRRDPVVIIPGHGASINFGEMFLKIRYPDIYTPAHLEESPFPWHMMPGVKIYNPLITALENAGYEEGRDLFVFNYNWLEKIRSEDGNKGSAEKLADFLNEKLEEGQKADVIAHSMGGLVARTCLQQVSGCPIDQLITVGTPHKGVVDTYGAWEGGEVWRPGLSKFAFSLVLHLARQEGESLYQTVQRLAPSTEEMLPTFSYLYAGDENEPLSYSFASPAYPQNTLLNQLSPPENLGESLKLIYGEGKDTLSGVKIKERSWYDQILGKWSHGKPIEKKYSFGGDGTVLVQSARPFENSSGNVAGFNFDHGEIISKNEALGKIFSFLNLPPPAVNGDVLFERNATDYLAFYLLSPAYLDINLMGILSENIFIGQEDQDKPKLIIIANPPTDWQKEVVVKGVDNGGEYVLGVGLARGEETSWQEYHGEIKSGEEDKFLIEATDKISLKSKESSGEKRQDEEMLNQLKAGFSPSSLLTEKLEHLTALMKISTVEALKYAYRIKNLVALEAKEKGTSPDDLSQMNKKLDQLIVYLEAAAENEEEIYPEGKAALAYQETKSLLEELEQLSPPSDSPFVISAAQSLTLAEESFPSSLPRDLGELIRLGRGYFLGINSKILLN